MSSPKPIALAAAGIAAVVLAFGAYTLGSSNSDEGTAGTATRRWPAKHLRERRATASSPRTARRHQASERL